MGRLTDDDLRLVGNAVQERGGSEEYPTMTAGHVTVGDLVKEALARGAALSAAEARNLELHREWESCCERERARWAREQELEAHIGRLRRSTRLRRVGKARASTRIASAGRRDDA